MRWRRIGRAGAKWACSALAVLVAAAIVASTWGTLETTLFGPAPPGYHDGGPGHRILYLGPQVQTANSMEAWDRFVAVISSSSRGSPNRAGSRRIFAFTR